MRDLSARRIEQNKAVFARFVESAPFQAAAVNVYAPLVENAFGRLVYVPERQIVDVPVF